MALLHVNNDLVNKHFMTTLYFFTFVNLNRILVSFPVSLKNW